MLGTGAAALTVLVDLVDLFIKPTFVVGRSFFLMGSCLEEVCSKIYRWLQGERELTRLIKALNGGPVGFSGKRQKPCALGLHYYWNCTPAGLSTLSNPSNHLKKENGSRCSLSKSILAAVESKKKKKTT